MATSRLDANMPTTTSLTTSGGSIDISRNALRFKNDISFSTNTDETSGSIPFRNPVIFSNMACAVVSDSNNNIYMAGIVNSGGQTVYNFTSSSTNPTSNFIIPTLGVQTGYIIKFNSSGSATALTVVRTTGSSGGFYSNMVFDQIGNLYWSVPKKAEAITYAVYNFYSGSSTAFPTNWVSPFNAYILTSSANSQLIKWTNDVATGIFLFEFNSSNFINTPITVDYNNNIFVTFFYSLPTLAVYNFYSGSSLFAPINARVPVFGQSGGIVIKWLSDGTAFSFVSINKAANDLKPINVCCDSTNSLYWLTLTTNQSIYNFTTTGSLNNTGFTTTGDNAVLIKYNSSGIFSSYTIMFLNPNYSSIFPSNLACDNLNNIYTCGFYTQTATTVYNFQGGNQTFLNAITLPLIKLINNYIVKWNSSGTIQGFTTFSADNQTFSGSTNIKNLMNMVVDTSNNIYVSGFYTSSTVMSIYNFYSDTTSLTTALTSNNFKFSLPATSPYYGYYVIRWSSTGTPLSWIFVPTNTNAATDSTAKNTLGLTLDKSNNLYYTGSYTQTYNISIVNPSSTNTIGSTRYTLVGTSTNSTGSYLVKNSTGFFQTTSQVSIIQENATLNQLEYVADNSQSRNPMISNSFTNGVFTICCDSVGSVYIGGTYSGSPSIYNLYNFSDFILPQVSFGLFIIKYNSIGIVSSICSLDSGTISNPSKLITDNSNNIYFIGDYANTFQVYNFFSGSSASFSSGWTSPFSILGSSNPSYNAFIIKYNSLGIATSNNVFVKNTSFLSDISLDGLSNIYYSYRPTSGTTIPVYNFFTNGSLVQKFTLSITGSLLIKWSSLGIVIAWTKTSSQITNVIIDSLNNIYSGITWTTGDTLNNFSSSGTQGTSTSLLTNGGGSTSLGIIKWNSNGLYTSQHSVLSSSQVFSNSSIKVDLNNNIFSSGYYTGSVSISNFYQTATVSSSFVGSSISNYNNYIFVWSQTGIALGLTVFGSNLSFLSTNLGLDSVGSVYLSGLYASSSAMSIYNFYTGSSASFSSGWSSPFSLPVTQVYANYLIKWTPTQSNNQWTASKWTTIPTSVIALTQQTMTTDNSSQLYIAGSYLTTSSVSVYDLSASAVQVLKYSYTPTTSATNLYFIKYDSNGIVYFNRPRLTDVEKPKFDNDSDAVNKIFADGNYEIVKVGNSTVSLSGQSYINPSPYNVGYFSSTIAINPVVDTSLSDKGLSVISDTLGGVYISGIYNNTTSTTPVYNRDSTNAFSLPVSISQDLFIIKYNQSGQSLGYTVIQDTGSGQSLSIALDKVGNVYVLGQYNNTSASLPIYNFSNTNIGLTTFALPPSIANDTYLVKWSIYGISLGYTFLQDTGSLNIPSSGSINFDSSNNLYLSSNYLGSVAVNNFSSITGSWTQAFNLSSVSGTTAVIILYNSSGIASRYTVLTSTAFNTLLTSSIVDPFDNVYSIVFSAFSSFPVTYLIVAGGGAGGINGGGGGGAGGLLTGSVSVLTNPNTITVGAGGVAVNNSTIPTSGSSSSAFGLTAIGGGYGATRDNYGAPATGGSGGGGSGAISANSAANTGASGTSGQGFAGGNSSNFPNTDLGANSAGGGGGGASTDGIAGASQTGGGGGTGTASSISGSSIVYAGGGGGGLTLNGSNFGRGGPGGGGNGASGTANGTSGTANTGGGGGGGASGAYGGSGGSGIVIISYAGSQAATGGTITSSGGNTIHTFTSSGTFSIDSFTTTTSVYNFTLNGTLVPAFTISQGSLTVIKWSSFLANSWASIQNSSNSSSNNILSDNNGSIYLTGAYNENSGILSISNFSQTNAVGVISAFLPTTSISNMFLIKWSQFGLFSGLTYFDPSMLTGASSGISLAGNSDIYLTGVYNSINNTLAIYNFYTGSSASFSSGFTSPFSLPKSVGNDTYIIRWSSDGTALGFTTLIDSGSGSGLSVNIDIYGSLHFTGFYTSTSSTLSVYNFYQSNTQIQRFMLVPSRSNATLYIKWNSDGTVDLGQRTQYFTVNIPSPSTSTSTSSTVSKQLILQRNSNYRYLINYQNTPSSNNIITIDSTLYSSNIPIDLIWVGSYWIPIFNNGLSVVVSGSDAPSVGACGAYYSVIGTSSSTSVNLSFTQISNFGSGFPTGTSSITILSTGTYQLSSSIQVSGASGANFSMNVNGVPVLVGTVPSSASKWYYSDYYNTYNYGSTIGVSLTTSTTIGISSQSYFSLVRMI